MEAADLTFQEEQSLKVLPMQAIQTAASVRMHRLLHSATFSKTAFADFASARYDYDENIR